MSELACSHESAVVPEQLGRYQETYQGESKTGPREQQDSMAAELGFKSETIAS